MIKSVVRAFMQERFDMVDMWPLAADAALLRKQQLMEAKGLCFRGDEGSISSEGVLFDDVPL